MVRIIQLTDLHLMEDARAELKGVRTRARLENVLRVVQQRIPHVDRLVVTGDLTHDEQRATYQDARQLLSPWLSRLRVIPGNHDDRALLRAVFPECSSEGGERLCFHERLGGWQLIGLDSQLPGEVRGRIGSEQLGWLEQRLDAVPDEPACIFVHHPPVVVNSPWLDQIGLDDAAELLAALRKRPRVRVVVSGHVHQEMTTMETSFTVLTTCPTSVPFRPETEELEVDSAGAGFRILDLLPGGVVRTRIERVTD